MADGLSSGFRLEEEPPEPLLPSLALSRDFCGPASFELDANADADVEEEAEVRGIGGLDELLAYRLVMGGTILNAGRVLRSIRLALIGIMAPMSSSRFALTAQCQSMEIHAGQWTIRKIINSRSGTTLG